MLLATMPELSSQEKRVGRHHTRVAHCVRSQQSSYLRFRLQFSGKAAVIAKVRLRVASLLMEVKGSEAQWRHREAGSEGSVEQIRGPMDKNWIGGLRRRGERASDREAHIHQGQPEPP